MNIRILSGLLVISQSLGAMIVHQEQAVVRTKEEQNILNYQLISATKAGDASRIKELLKKGALIVDEDPFHYISIHWAAIRGHINCLNILLDALENNTPLALQRAGAYLELQTVRENRHLIVRLFQRDPKSLAELTTCIEKCNYKKNDPEFGVRWTLNRILIKLKEQLSLNVVFNCFYSVEKLRSMLLLAGAELATDAHTVSNAKRQKHLDRLLLFAAREDDELVKALIESGANIHTVSRNSLTPLHIAAMLDNLRTVKILLDAGASIESEDKNGLTPLHHARGTRSFGSLQILLESGANIRRKGDCLRIKDDLIASLKILLQASIRRYAPTRIETKIALQIIARLVYVLSMHFPAYVIYEILLFAAGKQKNEHGYPNAPEWTNALKRNLAVIYLYTCNGNKLRPLWEQTIRCIVKDPRQQTLLISKLENYIQPFLGNEVRKIVCLRLMNQAANEPLLTALVNGTFEGTNRADIFGENYKLYLDHLQEYLHIDGLFEG